MSSAPTKNLPSGASENVQTLTDNKKEHPFVGCSFLLWASQDLNPGPSGYENVANFEIPFFL